MRVDLLDHQRLRVRGLVLLVVTEAPVADEVDHDVLRRSAAPIRHREPHRGDRGLGSSALTCTIGTSNPLARSDEYRVERPSRGSVVNPIWLFVIRCRVPPVE